MSSIKQEIDSIVKLAREVKEESVFQEKSKYKKFKAKKIGHRSEIKELVDKLRHLDFFNECIFWCHKFFEERICNKEEKYRYFYALGACYSEIKNHEKTIEFGQKFLDIRAQMETHFYTIG